MSYTRFDRCRHCGTRIDWVTRASDLKRMPVETYNVSPASMQAHNAVVLTGGHAYRPSELAEVVMTSRNVALEDAHTVVRDDFPWVLYHLCLDEPEEENG